MITEDYVSFEVAKLLKEKGFDGECGTSYYISNEGCENAVSVGDFTKVRPWREALIAAPTHQMAMKWLRKVHYIFIRVIQSRLEYCSCEIYYDRVRCYNFMESFDSYEQAVETALKYCLENLI